jgi:hypothetical protein
MITSTNAPTSVSDNAGRFHDEIGSSPASPGRSVGSTVFADPVAYLASFGIDSELIEIDALPVAA